VIKVLFDQKKSVNSVFVSVISFHFQVDKNRQQGSRGLFGKCGYSNFRSRFI